MIGLTAKPEICLRGALEAHEINRLTRERAFVGDSVPVSEDGFQLASAPATKASRMADHSPNFFSMIIHPLSGIGQGAREPHKKFSSRID